MTARPALSIGSVVIRVDDLERMKAFWTAALDYVARGGDDDTFALLRPRGGSGPNVSLDRVGLGATEVHSDSARPMRTT